MSRFHLGAGLTAALFLSSIASGTWADGPSGQRLTPSQAVAIALQNSPVLGASAALARQSKWSLNSELTKFAPTLLMDAGVTRTQNPSLSMVGVSVPRNDTASAGVELDKVFSPGTQLSLRVAGTFQRAQMAAMPGQDSLLTMGPGYGLSARVGVTQPLLRGAGNEVNTTSIRAAQAEYRAAQYGEEDTASSLARDTLNAYAELWYAARNTDVQTRSLEVASKQRDEAVQRERTGSLAQADVLSFETTVASRQESVLDADRERASKRLELARVMGAASGQGVDPVEDLAVPAPEQGDLVAEALARSTELKQLQATLDAAVLRARTAADPYRSRLDLDAYFQLQGLGNKEVPPAFTQLVGANAWSAHVGVTYELPLSGKRDAEASKAAAAVEAAQKNLAAAQARIRAEVDTLAVQERAARSRLALAERTEAIARQAADAQRARMLTGSATALQVIQAENEVRSAQLRALRATADAYEAVIALRRVTGRLVQYDR